MTRSQPRGRQLGITMIELVLATAVAALLFAGMSSVVMLGLQAQASGTAANEQVYQAGFAMERMISRTRAAPPRFLAPAASGTTGDWLAPLTFCFSAASASLRETTPEDTSCTAGATLANGVTAFSAVPAATTRPVDAPALTYTLTVAPPAAPQPVTVTASVRLGGGTQ